MTAKTRKFIIGAVVLIPILLGIAIYLPSLLTSRIAAYETSAFTSMLSLYNAEMKFHSQTGIGRYGSLEELGAAGLIDADVARGIKNGYRFEIITSGNFFQAYATPIVYGRWGLKASGSRSFFTNEDRLLTEADKNGARAGPEDEVIE
jgi:hypothetical protein